MKKYIFSSILISILLSCSITKNNYHSKIYNMIYNCQGIDIINNNNSNCVNNQMDNLNKLIKIDYLDKLGYSNESDTVYILTMLGIEGDFYFSAWSKNNTVFYTNEGGKLIQTVHCLFTSHMMKLVSKWDFSEIKKEEKINKAYLPERTIHATRIIFFKGKYYIECFTFSDFYNFERDG